MLCNSVPYISITRLSNRNVFVFSQMTKILCLSWTTKLTRVSSRESFWSSSCVGYWQLGFILIQFRKAAWIWVLESSDQTVKTMLGAHARFILNIIIVLCTLTLKNIFTRGLIHYRQKYGIILLQRLFLHFCGVQGVTVLQIHPYEQILLLGELIVSKIKHKGSKTII